MNKEIESLIADCEANMKKALPPWHKEPHYLKYVHLGFVLVAKRNPVTLSWLGYIGIPSDHPWFGKDYDQVDVSPHGGLTYSKQGLRTEPDTNLWWLGFDCSHAHDYMPGMSIMGVNLGGEYRSLDFVKRNMEAMAYAAAKFNTM